MVRGGFDEMPGLEPLFMRIGRRRLAFLGRHRRGVVGVIGAGAIDRRRKPHRRQQFRLVQRLALGPAFRGAGGGLFQHALGRLPVVENADDGGIGRLAGELRGVEHLFADDEAGARAVARFISRELVAGVFAALDRSHVRSTPFAILPATKPRIRRIGKAAGHRVCGRIMRPGHACAALSSSRRDD